MVDIVFSCKVSAADPSERPVTFLGKRANLLKVQYSDVAGYLERKVSTEVRVYLIVVGDLQQITRISFQFLSFFPTSYHL